MAVFEKILQSRPKNPYLVLSNSGEETVFALGQDIVSIGRSNANGIRLDDTNISKRHCLLVKTPQGVKIVDLESTNGTWINNLSIKEQVLRDGDRMRVGPFEFRFADGGFVPPPSGAVIPGETAVGHPFADLLVRELRRTPFWLISATIHLAFLLLLWEADFMIVPRTQKLRKVTAKSAEAEKNDLEENEEEKVEEEIDEPDLVLDPDDELSADPAAGEHPADSAVGDPDSFVGMRGRGRTGIGGDFGFGDLGLRKDDLGSKFGKFVSGLRGRGLDVAIVFDSTGSMQGIIDQVKTQISLMNTYIGALVPGNYRLAMVTYRDKNDEYVVKYEPFTRDYYQILLFIEKVNAAGGDDIPEAVSDGLKTAVRKLKWRKTAKKVILVFGDAPPHDQDLQQCRSISARFRRDGGILHIIFTEIGAREDALDKNDKKTVASFRSIANYGGGTFSFLDQESQIINSIQGLIFGKRFKRDVERTSSKIDFGWKGRLIEKKIRNRDIAFLLRHARAKVLHPLIVEGLIKLRDPIIEREMRKLAEDPEVPQRNRSAARYVLMRKGNPQR